jgi:hypothetical protein
MGASIVKQCESNADSDIKKRVILEIAKSALPQGEGFRFNLDALIDTMSKSGGNIYLPGIEKLISLATSEKAIYSPGVVMCTPQGIAVRCATFIDEFVDDYVDDFQESNQSLELAVARARAANGY